MTAQMKKNEREIARITQERDALAGKTKAFAADVMMLPTRIAHRLPTLSDADMSAICEEVQEVFDAQLVIDHGPH